MFPQCTAQHSQKPVDGSPHEIMRRSSWGLHCILLSGLDAFPHVLVFLSEIEEVFNLVRSDLLLWVFLTPLDLQLRGAPPWFRSHVHSKATLCTASRQDRKCGSWYGCVAVLLLKVPNDTAALA